MTTHPKVPSKHVLAVITLLMTIICIGCSALPNGDGDNGDGAEPLASSESPSLDSVRIQFRNLSTTAVDTQFYATDEPVEPLPGGLLTPDNLLRAGIGIGGTGILGPLSVDAIDLPCSETLVVGTTGGEFMDADLGTVLGNGTVRFMQAPFQFDCGAILVFEYSETTGGYSVILFQEN